MITCRRCRSSMAEALYGELDADRQPQFEEHLTRCADCAAEFDRFRSVLEVMDRRQRFVPDASFWEGYWSRLAPRLRGEKRPVAVRRWGDRLRDVRGQPAWTFRLAAAAALVVIGILIGKVLFEGPGGSPRKVAVAPAVPEEVAAVDARAVRYLQRSKVLLLGLVNFDPVTEDPAALDLSRTREISRELVQEAGALQRELRSPEQRRLRQLIEDLQVILLQIANLEESYDLPMVDLIQDGVDRRAILLKINLEEMRRAQQATGTGNRPQRSEGPII